MKDIDFDELDRAVSSLMGSVPKDEPKKSDEPSAGPDTTDAATSTSDAPQASTDAGETTSAPVAEPPVSPVSSATPASDVPKAQESENEPAAETAPASAPATPAASPPPSRGRFMDMVRPSARDTKRPAPSSPASRQGVTLQPTGTAALSGSAETVQQPETKPAQNIGNLNMGAGEPIEDTAAPARAETPAEPVEDTTPLTSPFLPDAKVEKRPLGRPAETTSPVELSGEPAKEAGIAGTEPSAADPTGQEDKDAQLPEQPLPAELDSTLLSIETSTEHLPQENQLTETPAVPETPEPATPAATENVTPAPDPTPAADPIRTVPAATSIPQQYKVQTEAHEETPVGGIYDTQPLNHPAEKKPGWLLIVAIIAILVLGAAGGAAVYYLGLL